MDVESTPKVTIEGGPGWQVDGSSPDVIGTDPGSLPRQWPSRALVSAVALSALLGFAVGTGLAVWRHDRTGEIDAATLSVSLWSSDVFGASGVPAFHDGRPTFRIPVELTNTGPRAVELVSVRLIGTDVVSEDLVGRRITPGSRARVVLLRPIDCRSEPRQVAPDGDVSRLAVRARTDAGEREVEVRAALNTGLLSRDIVVAMCGDLPPDEAVMTDVTSSDVDGAAALLSLQVGNGSRHRITVEGVRAGVPWLSARFVDAQRRAVPLPFALSAGDFSSPHQPWDVPRTETWRVELAVPDCRRVPRSITPVGEEEELPLLRVDVDNGERSATAGLVGSPYDLLRELAARACPSS